MAILEWDSHIDNKLYPYYTIKGIKHFTTMLITPFRGYSFLSGKWLDVLHCWRRLCHQKVTVRSTDTFRPHHAYGQRRNTENRQRLRGLATASLMPPLRLIAVPPCSLSPLPDKDFYDRPATCRLFQQSTGRDSDNPSSCVVGLSQTRPAGTGQCHFFSALLFFQINHVA